MMNYRKTDSKLAHRERKKMTNSVTSSWIDSFIDQLIAAGLATPDNLLGCSEEDIAEVESKLNIKLPEIYKVFLRRMGKESGDFMPECLLSFPLVARYGRESADAVINAKTDYRLPQAAFVFIERYGCQFFFFDTSDENSNPPVYRYHEGDKQPVRIADSFAQALEMALQDQLEDLDPESDKAHQFTV